MLILIEEICPTLCLQDVDCISIIESLARLLKKHPGNHQSVSIIFSLVSVTRCRHLHDVLGCLKLAVWVVSFQNKTKINVISWKNKTKAWMMGRRKKQRGSSPFDKMNQVVKIQNGCSLVMVRSEKLSDSFMSKCRMWNWKLQLLVCSKWKSLCCSKRAQID